MTAATSTSPPRSARNTGLLGPALALTAALCLTPLAGCGAGAGGTAAGDWNLLFVTFDTTRADALSCYGHEDAKTPTLDALAAEGFLFEQAFATVPITLPSHSSLFTGTYPMAHGVRENGSFRLAESRTTLAEVLGGAGFATGAAVGSFPLTRGFGIEQGFGFFDDNITAARRNIEGKVTSDIDSLYFDERPSQHVNDAILPFLEKQAGGRFFAWLHYWDPHQPLIPAPPFDQLFAHDLYQGEIAQADQSLGQILAELERLGVLEKTLIVMAGDHGEGHGEHGEDSHSLLAYNSTLHVPLIVKIPGREGGVRIADRVSTIDVMPTLLELLGLEAPPTMQGESLLPLIESGRREGRERPIYAETLSPRLSHGWGEQRAVFYGDQKYIHGPRSELYNLRLDPRELDDLAPQKPEDASEMKRLLEGLLKRYSVADAADSV
ncbi:MAG: sulfatase, partial [Acidobacteriota bacterium]